MSDQQRDPSPVGDWDVTDEPGEVTNEPDNARASDMGMVPEPAAEDRQRGGE